MYYFQYNINYSIYFLFKIYYARKLIYLSIYAVYNDIITRNLIIV